MFFNEKLDLLGKVMPEEKKIPTKFIQSVC